ncbi:MAG: CAP domain-containing protein [Paracoccaceae bacterium]|nr:CAP domain-containing protein [Paracoccaceae bacterium]
MRRVICALFIWLPTCAACADPVALQSINDYRALNDRAPLTYSTELEAAALAHATDMAQSGLFDHMGSDGSDVAQRVSRQGYGWCIVAENIAKGQQSMPEVMQDWSESPGHRRNMLSREVSQFALVEGPDQIWVMVLATPGC